MLGLRGFAVKALRGARSTPGRVALGMGAGTTAGIALSCQDTPAQCDGADEQTMAALVGLVGVAVGYGACAIANPDKVSYRPDRKIMILFGPP